MLVDFGERWEPVSVQRVATTDRARAARTVYYLDAEGKAVGVPSSVRRATSVDEHNAARQRVAAEEGWMRGPCGQAVGSSSEPEVIANGHRSRLPRSRRGSRQCLAPLILAGAGLGLIGCGDSDDREAAASDVGVAEASSRSGRSEPAGSDPVAVEPYLAELLVHYDQVVNQLAADPGIARDEDDPLVQEYLGLFEPDSEIAAGAIAAWVDNAEAGISVLPYNDEHPAQVFSVDGDVEAVSDDEVRFPICAERRHRIYDGEGRETQQTRYFPVSGVGVAVRLDGEWRLRRLELVDDGAGCRGGGT